jgi:iron complex outermembrane receptor protein
VTPAAHAPTAAPGWPAPLDRRITLRAHDIPLQQALDQVAAAGGVRLSYSRELLPRDRTICIDRESVAIGDILTQLLTGTDLDPLGAGGDQIVLRRRPSTIATPAPADTEAARDVQQLVPVVVTATADQDAARGFAGSTTIIDGNELAGRDARSLAELFDGRVPGVWTWQQPPSAFLARYGSTRGASSFGASSPKTYIDGIEVANPLLVTMLDPEHVERIEFIRGPQGAALYGSDALGGVVSITTRHDGSTDGRFDLRVRSSGGVVESRYSTSPLLTQSHSLTLRAGSPLRSFALAAAGDEIGSYLPGARSRQLSALGTARIIGSWATLGLTARLASADASSPLSSLLSGTGEVIPATLDSVTSTSLRQYTVGVNAQLKPMGNWRHSFVAGIDGYRLSGPGTDGSSLLRSGLDAASIELPAGADRISLRASSVVRLSDSDRAATTLTLGAEHTMLRQMSDLWTAAAAPLAEPVTMRGRDGSSLDRSGPGAGEGAMSYEEHPPEPNDPAPLPDAEGLAERRSNTGVSAQLDMALDDRFFLTGGLRMERIAAGDLTARLVALPMLGAGVVGRQGDLTVKLRGAYGKGVRAPRSATTFAYGPRAMMMASILVPEEQRGTEAAVELYFGRALSLQVTRFDQLASGLAQRVSIPSRSGRSEMQLQNVGEIMNRGWEFEQSLRLGALSLGSTLSLVDSRVRAVAGGYQGDLRAGDRMLDVPALTAGVTVGYQMRHTAATVGVSHARDWISYDMLALQSTEGVSGAGLRDYWRQYDGMTRLRASLSRDLGRGMHLVLSGDNLLDIQRGAPDNATILPGRTTTLTLRAAF